MNIYQIYIANENSAGFWVRRTTWSTTFAQILSVGGQSSGKLPGVSPYFGNPEVRANIYDSRTNIIRERNAKLRGPGTYTYIEIEHNP